MTHTHAPSFGFPKAGKRSGNRGGGRHFIGNVMPLTALAGASSPFEVGIRFPHCLIRPYATSVVLRPMRSHAGEAAAFRQKRNGNLQQMAVRFTGTCSTPACSTSERYIPQ